MRNMATNAMYMKNQHLFTLWQIVQGNMDLGLCGDSVLEVNKADSVGFSAI